MLILLFKLISWEANMSRRRDHKSPIKVAEKLFDCVRSENNDSIISLRERYGSVWKKALSHLGEMIVSREESLDITTLSDFFVRRECRAISHGAKDCRQRHDPSSAYLAKRLMKLVKDDNQSGQLNLFLLNRDIWPEVMHDFGYMNAKYGKILKPFHCSQENLEDIQKGIISFYTGMEMKRVFHADLVAREDVLVEIDYSVRDLNLSFLNHSSDKGWPEARDVSLEFVSRHGTAISPIGKKGGVEGKILSGGGSSLLSSPPRRCWVDISQKEPNTTSVGM